MISRCFGGSKDFNNRKQRKKGLTKEDCTKTYSLSYARLPGYEQLSQKDYREALLARIEEHRQIAIKKRLSEGNVFAGKEVLLATEAGQKIAVSAYFALLSAYRTPSQKYRNGGVSIQCPPGTYRPILLVPL